MTRAQFDKGFPWIALAFLLASAWVLSLVS